MGVRGLVNKSAPGEILFLAIKTVAAGRYYFDGSPGARHSKPLPGHTYSNQTLENEPLTENEKDYLQTMATNLSYYECAQSPGFTAPLMEATRVSLFERLQVKSRVGLVVYAVENGIVRF